MQRNHVRETSLSLCSEHICCCVSKMWLWEELKHVHCVQHQIWPCTMWIGNLACWRAHAKIILHIKNVAHHLYYSSYMSLMFAFMILTEGTKAVQTKQTTMTLREMCVTINQKKGISQYIACKPLSGDCQWSLYGLSLLKNSTRCWGTVVVFHILLVGLPEASAWLLWDSCQDGPSVWSVRPLY